MFRLMWFHLPSLALGSLGYGMAMTLLVGSRRFLATHAVNLRLLYVSCGCTFSFLVSNLLLSTMILLVGSISVRRSPRFLAVTPEGIRETGAKVPRLLPWSQIVRVVGWDGDIYVVTRPGRGSGLTIPRTAFSNNDSAKRFKVALVALWKSRGRPETVPDEVRAEFALKV